MLAVFALGVGPASATNSVALRCLRGTACFFTDSNFGPAGGPILNIQNTQHVWTVFPNTAGVCQGDWNDCASSVKSTDGTTIFAWRDAGCQNGVLPVPNGTSISFLGPSGFNDVISSDKAGSSSSGC
jgi:hypothetical protein